MLAKCYKCDTTIQTHIDMVHPICDECYNDFEDWLARELAILDNAITR
jgi:protein-arginine kinase activator protein McsA